MTSWIRDTSWRQGHLLGRDAIEALGLLDKSDPENSVVIVATHDCDLMQSPEYEPLVEVIIGCRVAKDGNCTHAKNPRKLHLQFSGASSFWCGFEATAKRAIDKTALFQFTPQGDAQLIPENCTIFQMWLANRYRRSAFSEEFEQRMKRTKLADSISKTVKPYGELISAVLFDVDEGVEVSRAGPDDTYKLDITILHVAEPDFEKAEHAATAIAEKIERAFKEKLYMPSKKWQDIELSSCEPVSESVLTYHTFRQLKLWRLEHISHAAEPQQPSCWND